MDKEQLAKEAIILMERKDMDKLAKIFKLVKEIEESSNVMVKVELFAGKA